jgi:hypothetical protein
MMKFYGEFGGVMAGRTAVLLCGLLLGWASTDCRAQDPLTPNTRKLATGQTGAPLDLTELSWLTGTWQGQGLGGFSEEIYSAPRGGSMLGMYRLIVDERAVFYELITIDQQAQTVVMKLKHFQPDLVGWEEKDQSVSFPFISREGNRYYFQGLTLERNGDDEVRIFVALAQKVGPPQEETFVHRRQKAGATNSPTK